MNVLLVGSTDKSPKAIGVDQTNEPKHQSTLDNTTRFFNIGEYIFYCRFEAVAILPE